ncbi:MAG: aldo/keto reductase, partial [Pirellulales bacterium]|nr:aldo/keto reductase [Pirellulales bacterium]
MKHRSFGASGRDVSEIGLGTWQFGGAWGDVDEATAEAILAAAVESGVDFFDTADVYGHGISEERIGKFLKSVDKEIFVATKLGRFPEPGWPDNFTLDVMRTHAQASAKRLGVDALDLIQLHCIPHEVMQQVDVFDHLRTLKQEGIIREFGASVESMEEAIDCLEQDGLASLQIIFNILRQKPIDRLFAKAQDKNVALIVRLPVASGLLTGKFTKDSKFSA